MRAISVPHLFKSWSKLTNVIPGGTGMNDICTMTDERVYFAELLMRLLAGMLFMFQGYDKMFRLGLTRVVATIGADPDNLNVPRPLLSMLIYFTSIAELAGGLLLLAGLATTWALYLLGIDLLLVSLAFTYMRPMWNMKYVLPRFALVVTLLIIPAEWHHYTADRLLGLFR